MRSAKTMLIVYAGILLGLSFSAAAIDYADHGAICKAIEANRTHAWAIGEKERFQTTCPCQLMEFEKMLEPLKYRAVVDWKIDAKAFAKNMPEGIKPLEFMSEIMPLNIKIEQTCK